MTLMTEDNVKFPIHAAIICGDSAYFNALFTGPLTNPGQREFLIRGIASDMMKTLLDFIYTRTILITEDNVIQVRTNPKTNKTKRVVLFYVATNRRILDLQILESADYLGIVALKDLCCQFIAGHMGAHNCIGIRNFAE